MKKQLIGCLALTLSICFTSYVTAQMHEPTEEHQILKDDVGVWKAELSVWMAPGTEPMKSSGKETITMLGELWALSEFAGEFGGMPFGGRGTTGFDPAKRKYVGTWIDSMTPTISHMEGTYDAETKTMTMMTTVMGPDGQPSEGKNVAVRVDEDTRNFSMYVKTGDEWFKSVEIAYTREK